MHLPVGADAAPEAAGVAEAPEEATAAPAATRADAGSLTLTFDEALLLFERQRLLERRISLAAPRALLTVGGAMILGMFFTLPGNSRRALTGPPGSNPAKDRAFATLLAGGLAQLVVGLPFLLVRRKKRARVIRRLNEIHRELRIQVIPTGPLATRGSYGLTARLRF